MKIPPEKIGLTDENHRLKKILSNIRYRNYSRISVAPTQSQSGQSRLEEVKEDLARWACPCGAISRDRLRQIKADLHLPLSGAGDIKISHL